MSTIPYVPTYLRATPPTIWPVTSPLDFGAIGNGSTDDYPAITAALHALVAKGGGTLCVSANDRDFRIATPGVHGIHLVRQSNITIMMGERSRLIMDNMVDGLAVSHGIFVEGPCREHLADRRACDATLPCRCRARPGRRSTSSARMSARAMRARGRRLVSRQSRRHRELAADRGGRGAQRAAGERHQREQPVGRHRHGRRRRRPSATTSRSASTWADGIYLRYFRNCAASTATHGIEVGDDGDLDGERGERPRARRHRAAVPWRGLGLHQHRARGQRAATATCRRGSIVPLGVRDTVTSRASSSPTASAASRFEPGTQQTLDYPTLNLNFLANRRVVIRDGDDPRRACRRSASCAKECNYATPRKWWRHDVHDRQRRGENGGSAPSTSAAAGIPQNGGPAIAAVRPASHFRNINFTDYTNPHTTLAGLHDCSFTASRSTARSRSRARALRRPIPTGSTATASRCGPTIAARSANIRSAAMRLPGPEALPGREPAVGRRARAAASPSRPAPTSSIARACGSLDPNRADGARSTTAGITYRRVLQAHHGQRRRASSRTATMSMRSG